MENKKKRISITGYGSFAHFDVNPASVIVNNLAKVQFPPNVEVSTEILPVSYKCANQCSTNLCETIKSDFIIHVGVNGCLYDSINLEERAFSHGYWSPDVDGEVPLMNRSVVELKTNEPQVRETCLNCDLLAQVADNLYPEIEVETSQDPGRYLCGYIYYSSLAKSNGRALFIHVSPFSEDATEEKMTEVVVQIVRSIAEQI